MTTTSARILIIDDNVNLARGFATALDLAGYDVAVAHTADDGLRLAVDRPPAAILLDFRMPFVNGVGFLYRLRRLRSLRNVPVMVITGASVNEETRMDLRDLGATLRFKPITLVELLEETRRLLAKQNTPHRSLSTGDGEAREEGSIEFSSSTALLCPVHQPSSIHPTHHPSDEQR